MKVYEIKYIEFVELPTQQRIEMQELYLVAQPYEIDCMAWNWGKVKKVQDMLEFDCDYEDILTIAKMEGRHLTKHSPARIVMIMFNSIRKQIEKITKIEAEAMAHQPTPKERAAAEAVGGFARFGTLPQTVEMVGIVAPSIKEVEAYPWSTVFNVMVFKHVQGEYKKHLYK